MTDQELKEIKPVHAVITWVDGNSETHKKKRERHLCENKKPLHENAINPHRWICNNEILFCLQSINNFAPWIQKIWIVIDEEQPDLSPLPNELNEKINLVYHKSIFGEYSAFLPTFNSIAIESMLWRIEGLSENFLYFNDDVFLTRAVKSQDFFCNKKTIIRGRWVNYNSLLQNKDLSKDPAMFNHFMQLNSAKMLGFKPDKIFKTAHVVHAFKRSRMEKLFLEYQLHFLENIKFKFRDLNQFSIQGLYNHDCIRKSDARIIPNKDYLHIHSGQETVTPSREMENIFQNFSRDTKIKFLCINDLPKLELAYPNTRNWLSDVVGGFTR